MCFNWKVIAGLAAVGVGLYIVAPNLVVSALPLLLLAACPLSMLFMGKSMMGGQNAQQASQPGVTGQYTCPMHPRVSAAGPGSCPQCGMALVPSAPPKQAPAPQPNGAVAPLTREEQLAQLKGQLQGLTEQQAALIRQLKAMQAAEATAAPVEPERPSKAEARPSKGALMVEALRQELRGAPAEPRPSKALEEAEQVARSADDRR